MPEWKRLPFDSLDGWEADDHAAALSCFRVSARGFANRSFVSRKGVSADAGLLEIANRALSLDNKVLGGSAARKFFEDNFDPWEYSARKGFVTAYFEPEVEASRQRSHDFPYPLYAKPPDLVRLPEGTRAGNLDPSLEWARRTVDGFEEFPDRHAIDAGALAGLGLELFWVRSAVEAFYIHVQGSARLLLDDGTSVRISYAGKSGHPYTSIGRKLVTRGVMTVDEANMVNIRQWLEADMDRALALLHENRSYIFFAELENHDPAFGPVAAAGVQLTPGRSLAVDKSWHAYGTPVWLSTEIPLPSQEKPWRRLMIAQDTGSAIVGPERGDIFLGSGKEAGILAGSVRHRTRFVVFRPKGKGMDE